MLTIHSISKSFIIDPILTEVSFTINPGERLGLVGPNGCGKTTLLRILAGLETPDSGTFQYDPPDLRLGYLPQGQAPAADETLGGFLDRIVGDEESLGAQLETLAAELARTPDQPKLQLAYDRLLARMHVAAQSHHQRLAVLAALGLDQFPQTTSVTHLSGGQKTRLALSGVLLSSPQLLLLDEPTNHLDIEMLEWLEEWLLHSPLTQSAAALIVSHDRLFLDHTVTGILELDPQTHRIQHYVGDYSDYLDQKLAERLQQWQAYTDQREEIARLRQAAASVRMDATFKRGGKADTGDKFAKGFFANRSKERVKRAKQIEKRLERLLTDEKIEKPRQSWQMKLDFDHAAASGRQALVLDDLSVGYDEHPLLSAIYLTVRYGDRVALVGPNGSGKTTLLNTIAGRLTPLGGTVRLGSAVRLGYMAQEQDTLEPELDALETIRRLSSLSETDARTYLHLYLFSGDDVFTPVKSLSYGERTRLMLACLVASGCNLLLLDEPVNHLDIPSRGRFEQALANFSGTVVAAVHDRYFIASFAATMWEIRQQSLVVQPLK
jgi:ATPase subunit of ABC transporter with duplicated ATPase domains